MRVTITAAVCAVAALASTASAEGRTPPFHHWYITELQAGNYVESHGLGVSPHKIAIDSATCKGLRRFGVQTGVYTLDKFWRFRCTAVGANGYIWDLSYSAIALSGSLRIHGLQRLLVLTRSRITN
jgi:hypothetical protein